MAAIGQQAQELLVGARAVERKIHRGDGRAGLDPARSDRFEQAGRGVAERVLGQHERVGAAALRGQDQPARDAISAARELELLRAQPRTRGDPGALAHPEPERLAIAGQVELVGH